MFWIMLCLHLPDPLSSFLHQDFSSRKLTCINGSIPTDSFIFRLQLGFSKYKVQGGSVVGNEIRVFISWPPCSERAWGSPCPWQKSQLSLSYNPSPPNLAPPAP